MNEKTRDRLRTEAALHAAEAVELDKALAASEPIARFVSGLEDDAPSLAWRSALNERLAEIGPRPRTRPWWGWVTGVTAVAAACFALSFVVRAPGAPVSDSVSKTDVEATIAAAYGDAEAQSTAGILLVGTDEL